MSVDISGLLNFKKSLNKRKDVLKQGLEDIVGDIVATKGLGIAYDNYFGFSNHFHHNNIIVDKESLGDGKFKVFAQDLRDKPQIAYHEFGTGYYAKGMYQGNLPTQTLTFISGGIPQSTNGWVYYYPNENTKTIHNGVYGWWYRVLGQSHFSSGNQPQQQMWNTSKLLRENLLKTIEDGLKEYL